MERYVIEIVCFQLLFLGLYHLVLWKETFFAHNRIYLLVTPLLAVLLPFVQLPALQNTIESIPLFTQLPELVIGDVTVATEQTPATIKRPLFTINWWFVYGLGVIISVLLWVRKLNNINRYYRFRPKGLLGKPEIIPLPNRTTAFTFFNTVFIGEKLDSLSRKHILAHELSHVKQKHSWDLQFFELLRIIFWFNPLVYYYQKNIATVHEFLADQEALKDNTKQRYYEGLLNTTFGTKHLSFVNTFFNHSLIKKRIVMLQKSKSQPRALRKFLLLLPLVTGILFYNACTQDEAVGQEVGVQRETNVNPNLMISLIDLGDEQTLIIGFRNFDLLTENELNFIEKAKLEDGFKDFTTKIGSGFFENGEFFFVNYTDKLKSIADNNSIIIRTADEIRALNENNRAKDQIQENGISVVQETVHYEESVPFAVIEQVPVFPGCEGLASNEERKQCMSNNVAKLVNQNFNIKLGSELGLTGINRIFVSFKIDDNGNITGIRSGAPHPRLEEEAIRVTQLLPQMQPGQQNGEPVGVLYSLPITFKVQE